MLACHNGAIDHRHPFGDAVYMHVGVGTAVQPAEREALEQLCSRQRDRHGFGNSCAASRETGMGTAVQPAERQAWEQLCSRPGDRHGNSCAAGRETGMGTAVLPAERQAWELLCCRRLEAEAARC